MMYRVKVDTCVETERRIKEASCVVERPTTEVSLRWNKWAKKLTVVNGWSKP